MAIKKFLDIKSIDVIWDYIRVNCAKKEDVILVSPISNDDIDSVCENYLYNSGDTFAMIDNNYIGKN